MRISLNWLTDYLDVRMPASELADLLTRVGVSCEKTIETPSDVVLDLEITSNRPDLLGHIGVARELAAVTGEEFRPPKIADLPTEGRVEDLTSVEVLAPDLCPRYTARVIRGVRVTPSPAWMVDRLEATGLRSINNIVDATNYVLLEYSQPLHAFDYDKLVENRIVVRRAVGGEQMVSIDETTCDLDESMLIIADANRPVAIAGIMGGLSTEVTDATVNVLIESAQFDPLTTRRTSRRLALMSESNYRFERGVDPVGVDEASLRACELIIKTGGGTLAEGIVDVWAAPFEAPEVAVRPERANQLLGMDTSPERQMEILARLGLSPRAENGRIACTIPPFRADLRREADLIEEIARLAGYDNIPVAAKISHEVVSEAVPERMRRLARSTLTGAGFSEAVTFTFIDLREAELFGQPDTVQVDAAIRKTNNALRPTLLPSLLRACENNQDAGNDEVSLFEIASVFASRGEGVMPSEHVELGMVTTDELRELRGALEAAVARIAPGAALAVRRAVLSGFGKATAAEILIDGKAVGAIGQVGADVQDHYGLERPIAAAQIDFDAVTAGAELRKSYRPLPRFPAVRRDLSVILDEEVPWAKLLDAIESVSQPLRESVEYVTTYRGKPVPPGTKSVTLTLTYRGEEGTLRRERVDEQVAELVGTLSTALGAKVRE